MISMDELLKGHDLTSLPEKHQYNLSVLLDRINVIREAWGKPLSVTSGYRSKEDHLRVYKELAEKRGVEFDEAKIPWGSQHLLGCAVDISDPDGKLYDWCRRDMDKQVIEAILWCEQKDDQPRVHFQINPPKSGLRFFRP